MRLLSSVLAVACFHLLAKTSAIAPPQLPLQSVEQQSLMEYSARKSLLKLHKDLVSIPSVTGSEHEVGKYMVKYLKSIGLVVETQSVSKEYLSASPWTLQDDNENNEIHYSDRFNIYAYSHKKNRDAHTLLTTHIDTVPPFLAYNISSDHPTANDTIFGRGSVDAKGSAAIMLTAYNSLVADDAIPSGSVAFLFVVGEETGGDGMRFASETLRAKFSTIIFGEPTQSTLACGHKGNIGCKIYAKGKAVHSGYPELGVSANEILLLALSGLMTADLPSSEKYGKTTVNIGMIEGGVAANVVAEKAEANIAIRLAGGTSKESKEIITAAIDCATKKLIEDRGGSVEIVWSSEGYGPIDIDCDVEGFETMTVNYGTDIPQQHFAGVKKRYLYGPGSILVAHSAFEALTVGQLEQGVEDYKKLVLATLDQ